MFFLRHLPDTLAALLGWTAQLVVVISLCRRPNFQAGSWRRKVGLALAAAGSLVMLCGLLFRGVSVARRFPAVVVVWTGVAALSWILLSLLIVAAILISRLIPKLRPEHSTGRRLFLTAVRTAAMAAPVATTGYAVFIQRSALNLREVDLPVANLPKELRGLRLVQVSDIHLSAFLSEAELARAIDMANETKPHLALVTGDLITSADDPLDICLRQLKRLRTDAGAIGCLGNHEVYAGVEDYTTTAGRRAGIDFLRSQSRVLRFGGQDINFAGVDYQKMKSPYLTKAEALIRPGMPNILLSHNPDVFPVAAGKGFDSTISGHTHGGQITVEILHQNLSVARFYTPYVYGLYRQENASLYVTRGIGTVGVPARLGAPPEIALIRLCAI